MLNIFKKDFKTLNSDLDTWVVTWNKRTGRYSDDVELGVQIFTNKEEAEEFKESLESANKLLGHTAFHLNQFKIKKMKNGL